MKSKFKHGLLAGIAAVALILTGIGAATIRTEGPNYEFEVIQINSDEYLLLRINVNDGKLEGAWVEIENEADELEWVRKWTEFKKM